MRSSFAITLVIAVALIGGAHAETPQETAQEGAADTPQPETNQGIPPEYLWTNVVTEFDRDRLARLDEAVALGTEESYGASATIRERAAFHKVMDAETNPVNDADLLGWWACRTIKVGGKFSGLVVYSWFDCKVSVRDGFLFFEKRSGSQRLSGRLYQDGPDRRVLLAAPTYNDEPQRTYSGPEGGITDPQRQDKAGILSQLEDGRLRVVFPWSVLESTYDVLELRRPD
ncbi:DUF4893 domain-containing protein [Parvibaculaceae bacterium PLY_AMNH_Bact1]|nr:DUF4893 domain-containing protein [Parvibaculaceae bacterium PLY_AMNH_Bact1]